MILYLGGPKNSTKRLLELIDEFGKVAGYKINAQKSTAFVYTGNAMAEKKKTSKINPILNSYKNNQIPWNKLNQGR